MEPNSRDQVDENYEEPKLKDDIWNFLLLTYLYILQYAVEGLVVAIRTILQERNVTYEEQTEFNFVLYPLMFKIFWAPIVDSIHIKKIGRRKSWLVITQYFTGALLLLISMNIDDWLGTDDGKRKPNVRMLTVTLLLCMLLNSVQDIALDAWSLTMLQKRNVASYAAIAENIGTTFALFVISASFIMLESKKFGNMFRSVPQNHGLVSFSEFSFFFSMVVLITNTLVLIFKKEKIRCDDGPNVNDNKSRLSIRGTYALLWKMLKMRPVLILSLFLLTREVFDCFSREEEERVRISAIWEEICGIIIENVCGILIGPAPVQNVGPLKLLDNGITKDTLATYNLIIFPFKLGILLLLSHYIIGRRPLRNFLVLYILRILKTYFLFLSRLINSWVYASLIFAISYWKKEYNVLPTWYYWPLLFTYNFQNVISYITMMTLTATFARISDPHFGGVYMTFFNSINTAGKHWLSSLTLWSVNFLNIRSCSQGKSCYTLIDGFYVQIIISTIVGVLWLFWARKVIDYIEEKDANAFRVRRSQVYNEIEERTEPLMNSER